MTSASKKTETTERVQTILDAAIKVFARFGYRKTSMSEVADAAQISRQGLYLHYPTKEELFRATLTHAIETRKAATKAALAEKGLALEARLLKAHDEWMGYYVGMFGAEAADLIAAAEKIVGACICEYDVEFRSEVAALIAAAPAGSVLKKAGFTPAQAAVVLRSCAMGLKHVSETRDEFRREMETAIRLVLR